MRNIIVGTAGHIDHGKTALVKALTGIDADRLKEEKARGITIDIGFAHMDIEDVRFGFIDVPGHERFVKNMLAGVGGIDMVILVVAADESVMPQTREHFDICRLLKIQSGLIAITKTDLADAEWIDLVEIEMREMAAGSFLENAEIVRVSSKTGAGIDYLRQALLRLSRRIALKSTNGLFRLPVDRTFTMRGFGTVVTGTLLSGQVSKDEEIEVHPVGRRLRVRGAQVYGEATDVAMAGQRTALNLHGVEVQEIERGMVIAHAGTLQPTSLLDVKLQLLPNAVRPLKNLAKVRLHHGASEILCRVALIGEAKVEPGGEGFAQLRLEQPTVAVAGDNFILREFSPMITLGGGVVLDSLPEKHKQTDTAVKRFLMAFEKSDDRGRLGLLIQRAGPLGLGELSLIGRLGFTRNYLALRLDELSRQGQIRIVTQNPFYVVDAGAYLALRQAILTELERYHRSNPLRHGISKEELREKFFGKAPFDYFKPLLDELAVAQAVSLQGEVVALFGHEISLTADEQALKSDLEALYIQSGVAPPALDEALARLADHRGTGALKKIYHLLIKEGTLVKISNDLTLHQKTLADIKSRLTQHFPKGAKIQVGDFKELFNISRKFAIPILEHLDKERVTRRIGSERVMI
ncbi:MAG: selenocysteine-specific translation elongation factor [Acidobacteria bacterium]|nr:selenocysteine-specific translation elongation factor [Acidobacteriota bacterium]MBI3657899.1 selenocysteine-specific translation elongation factor [Acidobacteriota bacterium]